MEILRSVPPSIPPAGGEGPPSIPPGGRIPQEGGVRGGRTGRTAYLALFLFLLAVYLFTYTPRINSSDGLAMFSTAESLVRRGGLDIEQIRWMGLQQGSYGLDGRLYSRKGLGLPLGLLPLTWLGLVWPWAGPVGLSLLFNALVTALTAVGLVAYLGRLGFSPRTGLAVALAFGLATLAWPYAKSLFSDPFSGLLLLGAAYALLRFRRAALFYPFLAGLLLGWNVATRYAEVLFVPVYGLLLLYYMRAAQGAQGMKKSRPQDRGASSAERAGCYARGVSPHLSPSLLRGVFSVDTIRRVWLPLAAFGLPLLLTGLGLIGFNLFRYGAPLNTGYLPNETFSAIWWRGIVGQLISPGRGLLLFCPILILSLGGVWPFLRRYRAEGGLALSIILIHLLLYGKWFMWHGGYAWGPRFMIPTLPFWALFLAPVVERWPRLFWGLFGLSLLPQLLFVAVDFAPVQNALLETGLPLYDPRTFFDLQYSPLIRGWRFLDYESLDLAWAWPDHFNGWLAGLLAINIGLSGLALRSAWADRTSRLPGLAALSTVAALIALVAHVHALPPPPLQEAAARLNRGVRPADAVITNGVEISQPLAELYRGQAPVLGLNNGGFPLPDDITERLAETVAHHRQIWWLPNWLPPEESAIEQTLLATGFRAFEHDFGGQRLALFAFPTALTPRPVPDRAVFADRIALSGLAAPPTATPGAALPLELRWRAVRPLREDYHVFIHLVAENGQKIAQSDGQPALWRRPTSTWPVGETIIDRHGLWIPPETPPGAYRLLAGLYDPAGGRRLLLPDGGDALRWEMVIAR